MNYIRNVFNFSPKNVINVLRINGSIASGSRSINLENFEKKLQAAFNDSKSRFHAKPLAVCLLINCPGGSPAQTQLLANRIRELSKKQSIPTFSFAEDVAASGGYMLLAAADECYGLPFSMLGSVGVISFGFGLRQDSVIFNKLGFEPRILTAGENKFRNNPFEPWKDEDKVHKTKILTKLHKIFVDEIKLYRKDKLSFSSKEEENEIFSGEVFDAAESLKFGLIDGIGDFRTIMKARYGDDLHFKFVESSSFLRFVSPGTFYGEQSYSSFGASLGSIFHPNNQPHLH